MEEGLVEWVWTSPAPTAPIVVGQGFAFDLSSSCCSPWWASEASLPRYLIPTRWKAGPQVLVERAGVLCGGTAFWALMERQGGEKVLVGVEPRVKGLPLAAPAEEPPEQAGAARSSPPPVERGQPEVRIPPQHCVLLRAFEV